MMQLKTPLNVLLLCDDRPGNANTILDHIRAFLQHSRHKIRTFNPIDMRRSIALDLDEFDVVVIHYSLVLSLERHVAGPFRDKLRLFRGLKVQFIQDEYRWVDRVTAASRDAGIDILFTAAPEPAASRLYDERLPGVRRVHTLTGYVPEYLVQVPRRPIAERAMDVVYRGRDLPFWLGRLAQEKQWIAQELVRRAPAYGLRTDIGWREGDRIYGDRWVEFVASGRATLGTESGASIADFDGRVERGVRKYLRANPAADFAQVSSAVLEPYEGNVVINVISPRVFEAAALGTALVMFPGEYSGIAEANRHYIPLEKDFSNMDEVVAQLTDARSLEALIERTHRELVASGRWSFASFVEQFDAVIAEEAKPHPHRRSAPRHRVATLERKLRVPPPHVRLVRGLLTVASAARRRPFAHRSDLESGAWLAKGGLAVRTAIADAELRPIFLEGRRAGVPIDSLLEEILELSLLRDAATGRLHTVESFVVAREFDSATRSIRFTSIPSDEVSTVRDDPDSDFAAALDSGDIEIVEWDNTAVGRSIHLTKPRLEIGIGSNGIKRYSVLAEVVRRDPRLLKRALAPLGRRRGIVPSGMV